jgi:hypothetical protein
MAEHTLFAGCTAHAGIKLDCAANGSTGQVNILSADTLADSLSSCAYNERAACALIDTIIARPGAATRASFPTGRAGTWRCIGHVAPGGGDAWRYHPTNAK